MIMLTVAIKIKVSSSRPSSSILVVRFSYNINEWLIGYKMRKVCF